MKRASFAAAVLALAATITGCGDDGPALTTPPPTPTIGTGTDSVEVVALDNSFRPDQVTVAVGTEVRFVNRGRNEHDALSVAGDTWGVDAVDFGPGDEYVHVFDEPGTYHYYCSLHGNADVGMVGVITVESTGE